MMLDFGMKIVCIFPKLGSFSRQEVPHNEGIGKASFKVGMGEGINQNQEVMPTANDISFSQEEIIWLL